VSVDFRALLKKYVDHVGDEEGTVFIDEYWLSKLTPEEAAEMRAIDAELLAEGQR